MKVTAALLMLAIVSGCASVPVEQRPEKRQQIDQAATDTLAALVTQDPAIQDAIDQSVGYLVGQISAISVPVFGGGVGLGVLVDRESRSRIYMNINRFDLGVGLGARTYRVVMIFQDRTVMEAVRSGRWETSAAIDASAGTTGTTAAKSGRGYSTYFLSDSGAIAAASARMIRASVNHDLTDTGISEFTIPNRDFNIPDGHEKGPRVWDRKLPFLAQSVIDKGFDLPLPLGTGLSYAYTDQEQLIDQLEIGLGGKELVPINFVTFDNAFSKSNSVQFRFDTWILPFMNVFAMVGGVDGHAPLDVTLDGNQALEDLQNGGLVDCAARPTPPICRFLEDSTVTLPFTANFDGSTYGFGTVLAAGWKGWFATIPIIFTHADLDSSETDGLVTTITPRFGKMFGLGNAGNLGLFAGGQYLRSKLSVTGSFDFGDSDLFVDYRVRQRNKDRWNMTIGGNWAFNKYWSWSMEYSGFTGSREVFATGIGLRF